jgi:dipeptidase E
MGEQRICAEILRLSGVAAPRVLYLGTATYDAAGARARQTQRFVDAGCAVSALDVAHATPAEDVIDAAFAAADVLVVSGGNTLFAVDRWHHLGIARRIREHAHRLVLTGGSAGAICWFDSGHSDSADPTSFRHPPAAASASSTSAETPEALAAAAAPSNSVAAWEYVRIDGLGLLPGLLCPHHDKVQSNGVLRAHDLDAMLLRHAGERAVCIDHFAALVVDGERYRIVSLEGQPGSVLDAADGAAADAQFAADRSGRPGVWLKEVDGAAVRRWLAPSDGLIADLLRPSQGALVADERVDAVRAVNSAVF